MSTASKTQANYNLVPKQNLKRQKKNHETTRGVRWPVNYNTTNCMQNCAPTNCSPRELHRCTTGLHERVPAQQDTYWKLQGSPARTASTLATTPPLLAMGRLVEALRHWRLR